ncbi:hypothetical protein ABXS75_02175 [Roseburia hominis]
MEFFKKNVPKNGEALKDFCEALKNGEPKEVEKRLGEYLKRTISIRDTFVKIVRCTSAHRNMWMHTCWCA